MHCAPAAAAAAARPEQPALHIKRTNEGTGGEMKKMACSHTHHGRGRRSVAGDGLEPSSIAGG